jgi:hypothetical protein
LAAQARARGDPSADRPILLSVCGDGRARRRRRAHSSRAARSAFGLLAAVQRFGSLAASAIAVLWTLVSPRVAFAT